MKWRIIHALQKYLLNPPIKLLFAIGVIPPGYALLETVGRKSGKPRRTPVGDGRVNDQFWIVAEHGMTAGYVRNIARRMWEHARSRMKSASTGMASHSTPNMRARPRRTPNQRAAGKTPINLCGTLTGATAASFGR